MARPKKNVEKTTNETVQSDEHIENFSNEIPNIVTENVIQEEPELIITNNNITDVTEKSSLDDLSFICEKYGSDKGISNHGFTPFYDKHLSSIRVNAKKIVEIGVDKGNSLKMWKEYFPNATIIGADVNIDPNLIDERIKLKTVDQSKRLHLVALKEANDADVIIDDGSHMMNHQQTTLGVLFMKLKKGGFYILEDLHTSLIHDYVVPFQNDTTLDFIIRISEGYYKKSRFMTSEEAKYLKDYVKSVEIFRNGNPITCIIAKK